MHFCSRWRSSEQWAGPVSRTIHVCGPCAGESLYAFWRSATESDQVRPNRVANSDSRRSTGRCDCKMANQSVGAWTWDPEETATGPSRYCDGIEHYR